MLVSRASNCVRCKGQPQFGKSHRKAHLPGHDAGDRVRATVYVEGPAEGCRSAETPLGEALAHDQHGVSAWPVVIRIEDPARERWDGDTEKKSAVTRDPRTRSASPPPVR